MIAKALKSLFPAPRATKWDAREQFKAPSRHDPETAYKIHLGDWSRYR